jgi:hypothetical protein
LEWRESPNQATKTLTITNNGLTPLTFQLTEQGSLTIDFGQNELDDIYAWVNNGGGLFINYDCCDDTTAPVLAALFDIFYMGYNAGGGGVTTDIYPHPTTDGVTAVNLPNPYQYLTIAGSAVPLVDDVADDLQIAANEVGGGRVVVVDDDSFNDGTFYDNDNALLAMNIFDWLAVADVPWLSEDPITGTVAPGNLVEIEVTFGASAVDEPGNYLANLRVGHNDPMTETVVIPLTFTLSLASPGTHTVEIAVWNCTMTVPITDTVAVVVSPMTWESYLPLVTKSYAP